MSKILYVYNAISDYYHLPIFIAGRRCGGVFKDVTQGSIVSPNWPGNYPTNSDCTWEVIPEKNRKILIVIPEIDLDSSSKTQLCGDKLIMRRTGEPLELSSHRLCSRQLAKQPHKRHRIHEKLFQF